MGSTPRQLVMLLSHKAPGWKQDVKGTMNTHAWVGLEKIHALALVHKAKLMVMGSYKNTLWFPCLWRFES